MDPSKWDQYLATKKDDSGNVVPELSLIHMMEQQPDFVKEKSQLEFVCQSLLLRGKRNHIDKVPL